MVVPLVYFAYNRVDAAVASLDAISSQTVKPPVIIAILDGPKNDRDKESVDAVRRYIKSRTDMSIEFIERPKNLGCAPSIVGGLNIAADRYDKWVVVEDDVVVSPYWYESMLVMLGHYQQDEDVIFSVGGYPTVNEGTVDGYPHDVIISPRFSCWGWGTWANRWNKIRHEMLGGPHDWNANNVSDVAGRDIPHALRIYQPREIWDATIAAACVWRGWQHALTRTYMSKNLGCDYQPDIFRQDVPERFAPPVQDDYIANLVRQHVYRPTAT